MQPVLRMSATRCTKLLSPACREFAKAVLHKNYAEHSAQIARDKLRGRSPWKPAAQPWHITILFALIFRIPTTAAISPRQKKVPCAQCPRHSRWKPIWHASKRCDHVEKATEFQREAMSPDGCSLGGACLTRLLALGKIPVEPLNARLDKDSRSDWSKYRICLIALLLYTF